MKKDDQAFPNKMQDGRPIPGMTKEEYISVEIFKALASNPAHANTDVDEVVRLAEELTKKFLTHLKLDKP